VDQRTNELLERILQQMGSGGTLRTAGSSGNSNGGGAGASAGRDADELIRNSRNIGETFQRLASSTRLMPRTQRDFQNSVYANRNALDQLEKTLSDFEKGIIDLDREQEQQIRKLKKEAEARERNIEQQEMASMMLNRVGGAVRQLGSQLIGAAINIAGTIQGGASGFGIAGAVIESQAQITNTVLQGVSTAGTTAGLGLMAAGGKAKLFGIALAGVSTALGVASDLYTQALVGYNRIIVAEGEKLLNAVKSAAAAGALMADGADGMLASLNGSMYTLEDYAEMVKSNSGLLAEANMGVGQAANMFGKVNKELGPVSKGLLSLGIGYREQGAIIADVMADMRRRDPTAELNEKVVAQRTKDYAVNLATLTALTGENAKALQDDAKKRTSQLAFQQFLATLGDKGPQVEKAFAVLTPQIQQNVMDLVNFGGVINKQGAVMTALNPALARMQDELAAAARAGTLTQESAAAISAKYRESVNNITMSDRALGLAAAADPAGALSGVATEAVTLRDRLNKLTTAVPTREQIEALVNAQSVPEGQQGPGLQGTFNYMEEAGQLFRKRLQESIIPRLDDYAAALKSATDYINGILNAGPPSPLSLWEKLKKFLSDYGLEIAALAGSFLLKKGYDILRGPKGPDGGPGGRGSPPTGGPDKPGAPAAEKPGAKPGDARPAPTGGMTPEQKAEYDRLRQQGVPAEEAKKRAGGQNRTPLSNLSRREQAIAQETARKAAEDAARKEAADAAAKAAGKEAAEAGAKGVGKSILKKIPGISILAGLGFGAQRAFAGDFTGAGMEVASGVVGTVPLYGTAGSVAIDAALAARDINKAMNPAPAAPAPAPAAPKPPAPPPPPPPAPAKPAPAPGPNSGLADPKQFQLSVQSGVHSGLLTSMKDKDIAQLMTGNMKSSVEFALASALNPAREMTLASHKLNDSTLATLSKTVAALDSDIARNRVIEGYFDVMSKTQKEQLDQIKTMVTQNESIIEFYKVQKESQIEIAGVMYDSKDLLSKILRSNA
jgi:hypothetical protein